MAEEGRALDLDAFEKQLQSLFKNGCSTHAVQVDGKTFCTEFRKLVEEYTCQWQTPLPQLRIFEIALCYFVRGSFFFPVGCDDVHYMLSSLALSVFELLLFFEKNEDPLKHFTATFQECHVSLARHQNVHLLQVSNCLQDGGPWANATLQSILTESTLPQTEVDRYISSQLPVLLELRIHYLLSCERVGEAMALAKCCSKHPTAGQHHFFLQVYLTWLHKTSQHDLLNKEVADLNGKDAVHIICNMENDEKDESLLALTRAFLSQQLRRGDMDHLCDLVFIWSKLHMRLQTSKQVLLEESHELMLSATNVNSIFPFIRVIVEELGRDGFQFCVELCTKALQSCLPCEVLTKSLICKTIAGLFPNDLEMCRACALLVFFLEPRVEAYKRVFLLYTYPDQEYHAEASPVGNHVRFETLQVLKKGLHFDPELWNLMALRASCITLMSEKVESAALEEIMEDKWVPDYCTKYPTLHLNTHSSDFEQTTKAAHQAGAKKRQNKDDKNHMTTRRVKASSDKAAQSSVDHAVKKKGNPGSRAGKETPTESFRRSYWQPDKTEDSSQGNHRRITRLSEQKPTKRKIRKPRWLIEDSETFGNNSTSRNKMRHENNTPRGQVKRNSWKTQHPNQNQPPLEKRQGSGPVKNSTKDKAAGISRLTAKESDEHHKKLSMDFTKPTSAPEVILELSQPDNEVTGSFPEETFHRQRGHPQMLLYKSTVKVPIKSQPEKPVHRKEVVLRSRDESTFVQHLHCYARRPKGKGVVSNIQASVSTITRSSVQSSPPKVPPGDLCEKPVVEMKVTIASQSPETPSKLTQSDIDKMVSQTQANDKQTPSDDKDSKHINTPSKFTIASQSPETASNLTQSHTEEMVSQTQANDKQTPSDDKVSKNNNTPSKVTIASQSPETESKLTQSSKLNQSHTEEMVSQTQATNKLSQTPSDDKVSKNNNTPSKVTIASQSPETASKLTQSITEEMVSQTQATDKLSQTPSDDKVSKNNNNTPSKVTIASQSPEAASKLTQSITEEMVSQTQATDKLSQTPSDDKVSKNNTPSNVTIASQSPETASKLTSSNIEEMVSQTQATNKQTPSDDKVSKNNNTPSKVTIALQSPEAASKLTQSHIEEMVSQTQATDKQTPSDDKVSKNNNTPSKVTIASQSPEAASKLSQSHIEEMVSQTQATDKLSQTPSDNKVSKNKNAPKSSQKPSLAAVTQSLAAKMCKISPPAKSSLSISKVSKVTTADNSTSQVRDPVAAKAIPTTVESPVDGAGEQKSDSLFPLSERDRNTNPKEITSPLSAATSREQHVASDAVNSEELNNESSCVLGFAANDVPAADSKELITSRPDLTKDPTDAHAIPYIPGTFENTLTPEETSEPEVSNANEHGNKDMCALTLRTEIVTELATEAEGLKELDYGNSDEVPSLLETPSNFPNKIPPTSSPSANVQAAPTTAEQKVKREELKMEDTAVAAPGSSRPMVDPQEFEDIPQGGEESKLEYCCILCNKVLKGKHGIAHAMLHYRKDECMFCGMLFKDDILAMIHLSEHLEKIKKQAGSDGQENEAPETQGTCKVKTSAKAETSSMFSAPRRGRPRKPIISSRCLTPPKSTPSDHRKLRSKIKSNDEQSTQKQGQDINQRSGKTAVHKVNGHLIRGQDDDEHEGTKLDTLNTRGRFTIIQPEKNCHASSDVSEGDLLQERVKAEEGSSTTPLNVGKEPQPFSPVKTEEAEPQLVPKTETNGGTVLENTADAQDRVWCPVEECTWYTVPSKSRVALLYHALDQHYGNLKPLELAFSVGKSQCYSCGRATRSFLHYQHHVECHRLIPRHPCLHKGCEARFKTTNEMIRHSRKHDPLQAVCCLPGCPKLFICRWQLNLHEREHYTPKPNKKTDAMKGKTMCDVQLKNKLQGHKSKASKTSLPVKAVKRTHSFKAKCRLRGREYFSIRRNIQTIKTEQKSKRSKITNDADDSKVINNKVNDLSNMEAPTTLSTTSTKKCGQKFKGQVVSKAHEHPTPSLVETSSKVGKKHLIKSIKCHKRRGRPPGSGKLKPTKSEEKTVADENSKLKSTKSAEIPDIDENLKSTKDEEKTVTICPKRRGRPPGSGKKSTKSEEKTIADENSKLKSTKSVEIPVIDENLKSAKDEEKAVTDKKSKLKSTKSKENPVHGEKLKPAKSDGKLTSTKSKEQPVTDDKLKSTQSKKKPVTDEKLKSTKSKKKSVTDEKLKSTKSKKKSVTVGKLKPIKFVWPFKSTKSTDKPVTEEKLKSTKSKEKPVNDGELKSTKSKEKPVTDVKYKSIKSDGKLKSSKSKEKPVTSGKLTKSDEKSVADGKIKSTKSIDVKVKSTKSEERLKLTKSKEKPVTDVKLKTSKSDGKCKSSTSKEKPVTAGKLKSTKSDEKLKSSTSKEKPVTAGKLKSTKSHEKIKSSTSTDKSVAAGKLKSIKSHKKPADDVQLHSTKYMEKPAKNQKFKLNKSEVPTIDEKLKSIHSHNKPVTDAKLKATKSDEKTTSNQSHESVIEEKPDQSMERNVPIATELSSDESQTKRISDMSGEMEKEVSNIPQALDENIITKTCSDNVECVQSILEVFKNQIMEECVNSQEVSSNDTSEPSVEGSSSNHTSPPTTSTAGKMMALTAKEKLNKLPAAKKRSLSKDKNPPSTPAKKRKLQKSTSSNHTSPPTAEETSKLTVKKKSKTLAVAKKQQTAVNKDEPIPSTSKRKKTEKVINASEPPKIKKRRPHKDPGTQLDLTQPTTSKNPAEAQQVSRKVAKNPASKALKQSLKKKRCVNEESSSSGISMQSVEASNSDHPPIATAPEDTLALSAKEKPNKLPAAKKPRVPKDKTLPSTLTKKKKPQKVSSSKNTSPPTATTADGTPTSPVEEKPQKVAKKKPRVPKDKNDPSSPTKKKKPQKVTSASEPHKTKRKPSGDPSAQREKVEKNPVETIGEVHEAPLACSGSSPGGQVFAMKLENCTELKIARDSQICEVKEVEAEATPKNTPLLGKRPFTRPPPTAYLDECYTSMPKRRKVLTMFQHESPARDTSAAHSMPSPRQRCASCFTSFSSTEELQTHQLEKKCSNLFGFDSDDEGN